MGEFHGEKYGNWYYAIWAHIKNTVNVAIAAGTNIIGKVKVTDGTDELAIDASGRPTVNVAGTVPVSSTDLDIRDLTSASDSVKVEGNNTNAVKVDGSAVTQPVSGSVTVSATDLDIRDLTSASDSVKVEGNNTNAVKVDGSGVTQPVSGTVTATATDLDIRNLAPATDEVKVGDGTTSLAVNAADGAAKVREQNVDADGKIEQSAHHKGYDYTGLAWENIGMDPTTKGLKIHVVGGGATVTNTDTVDNIHASATPTADYLLALDATTKFPNSVLNTGSGNGLDADTVDAAHAGVATGNVFKLPAGIAQGDIFYVDASGNVVRLAAGTSGQFLKTQGAGANPAWAATSPGEGHITIIPYNTSAEGQGTWEIAFDAGYILQTIYRNEATHANGDNISWQVYLAAGTYTLQGFFYKHSAAPIVDFDIDADEVASFDLYSATAQKNAKDTQTGIVVATAGVKTLKMRVDGKNASSSNYYAYIHLLALWRTA